MIIKRRGEKETLCSKQRESIINHFEMQCHLTASQLIGISKFIQIRMFSSVQQIRALLDIINSFSSRSI